MKITAKNREELNRVLPTIQFFGYANFCGKPQKNRRGEYVVDIGEEFISDVSEIITNAVRRYILGALRRDNFGVSERNKVLDYLEKYGGEYVYSIYKIISGKGEIDYVLSFKNEDFSEVINYQKKKSVDYLKDVFLISHFNTKRVNQKFDKVNDTQIILVEVTLNRQYAYELIASMRSNSSHEVQSLEK